SSSSSAFGATTTSAVSPSLMRLRIAGAVANEALTWWPVSRWNESISPASPGSTAPALSSLISAPAAQVNGVQATATIDSAIDFTALSFRYLDQRHGIDQAVGQHEAAVL